MIEVTIPGEPLPWRRAGSNNGRRFTVPVVVARQQLVATMAIIELRRAGLPPFAGPVSLDVLAVYPRPKRRPDCVSAEAWATGERVWRPVDGDCDNLAKLIADALQPGKRGGAAVYADDAQVVELRARKVYAGQGEAARTIVRLEAV